VESETRLPKEIFLLFEVSKIICNCRNAVESSFGIGIFSGGQLLQSGISIPSSGSFRYRWSRITPALPSYVYLPFSVYRRLCGKLGCDECSVAVQQFSQILNVVPKYFIVQYWGGRHCIYQKKLLNLLRRVFQNIKLQLDTF
jgi:hypothetical protein